MLEGRARWGALPGAAPGTDPELKRQAETWPVGGFDGKKVDNLLFYDYGFAMNALIKYRVVRWFTTMARRG